MIIFAVYCAAMFLMWMTSTRQSSWKIHIVGALLAPILVPVIVVVGTTVILWEEVRR